MTTLQRKRVADHMKAAAAHTAAARNLSEQYGEDDAATQIGVLRNAHAAVHRAIAKPDEYDMPQLNDPIGDDEEDSDGAEMDEADTTFDANNAHGADMGDDEDLDESLDDGGGYGDDDSPDGMNANGRNGSDDLTERLMSVRASKRKAREALELSMGHDYRNNGPMTGDTTRRGVVIEKAKRRVVEAIRKGHVTSKIEAKQMELREAKRLASPAGRRGSALAADSFQYQGQVGALESSGLSVGFAGTLREARSGRAPVLKLDCFGRD